MNFLLDSHYVLWAVGDTKKLSEAIKNTITNPDNRIVVSTVSFWEIALKCGVGKLEIEGLLPEELPATCLKNGFEIDCLSAADSSTFHNLTATYHKDPFDRMLIWQAIRNNYTLITVDKEVKKYTSEGLRVFVG